MSSIFDTRRQQVFPVLTAAELLRMRRFGHVQSFEAGSSVARVGEAGLGLTVVLAGHIAVGRQDQSGVLEPIVTHGPGSFMGELAQLFNGENKIGAKLNVITCQDNITANGAAACAREAPFSSCTTMASTLMMAS